MNSLRLLLVCCLVGLVGGCRAPDPTPLPPGTPPSDEPTDPNGGGEGCGFESFDHPVGFPCNAHRDCLSGQCITRGSESFCTQACNPSATGSCPDGMNCRSVGTAGRCEPADPASTLPADGSLRVGSPCNATTDCAADSVCAAVGDSNSRYYTFCAPPCQTDADCNGCGTCDPFGGGRQYCTPKGSKPVGEACETRHDCESFLCLDFCTQGCGQPDDPPCPTGSTCEAASGSTHLCVLPSQKQTASEGESCRYQFECSPGSQCLLDDAGIRSVCTAPRSAGQTCRADDQCARGLSCRFDDSPGLGTCQAPGPVGAPCETDAQCQGTLACRSFSTDYRLCSAPCRENADCGAENACVAVDIDTSLAVYASVNATTARASNDDIDPAAGNTWSRIRFTAQPGTYWVRVAAPTAFRGRYTLEILDGVNVPTPFAEIGGELNAFPNGTLADAQVLDAFPAVVSGVIFDPEDVDFYRFTVPGPEPVNLVVQTGPGAPSACLPAWRIESVEMGNRCRFNQECASGVCERQLGVCGGPCDADTACADGFSCVALASPTASHPTCVADDFIGVRPTGAACAFHHECADAYCTFFRGERMCAPRCDDESNTPCGDGLECVQLDVFEGGQSVQHRACVAAGAGTAAFNTACLLQSDCASGLVCDEGVCRSDCRTSDDCPSGATPPVDDEITCKPCENFTNCGADAKGECWNDAFCVRPCAEGACPAGFSCQSNDWGDFCVPKEGTCHSASCRAEPAGAEVGLCVVPSLPLAHACRSSFDCLSGVCANGLCSTACQTDAECGCPNGDFACTDAQCARAPGIDEEAPNDDESSAQTLTGDLPLRVYASIRHPGEVDFFKLTLPADSVVNVSVHKLCNLNPYELDMRLHILQNGRVLASDSPHSYLGRIDAFVATTGGEYFIKVEDEPLYSKSNSDYILTIETYQTP